MQKYHVTKVYATDKKKDGSTIINKYGKTSWRVGIKVSEHGDEWINGFLPFNPDNWEGSEQMLEIYEEEFNGQMQKKFRLAPKNPTRQEFDELSRKVTGLIITLEQLKEHTGLKTPSQTKPGDLEYPEFNSDDSPF